MAGFKLGGFLFRTLFSAGILVSAVGLTSVLARRASPEKVEIFDSGVPAVNVETAELQKDGLTFSVDGTVVPYREVPLTCEVSGRVTYLAPHCRVGRYVKEGEKLLEIDTQDYLLAQRQAQQSTIQASRQISELNVTIENHSRQLELARRQLVVQQSELVRSRELAASGALSQSDVESAEIAELTRRDAVQSLENQVRISVAQRERLTAAMNLAKVAEEKAQLDLDRCVIRAPFDGVVVELGVEQEKFVQRGEKLFTVHDTSRLEVRCSLYMKHVEWLWSTLPQTSRDLEDVRNYYQFPKTDVKILYDLENVTYAWRGTLQYLDGPGLDARTRMLPCRVEVENPMEVRVSGTSRDSDAPGAQPSLLPGMFVRIEVHTVPRREFLSLSESAVLPGGTVWKVVTDPEGATALARAIVSTAHFRDGRVVVGAKKGVLEAGDRVVVSPLADPVPGMKVEVLP